MACTGAVGPRAPRIPNWTPMRSDRGAPARGRRSCGAVRFVPNGLRSIPPPWGSPGRPLGSLLAAVLGVLGPFGVLL
eukprot:2594271-Pyramimonas_sp.AAC.1